MISGKIVASILPAPDLGDIEGGDLENDMTILLNWIKLTPQELKDPTPRIKSAIRSILKDEINQLQFVKLLASSINRSFTVEGIGSKVNGNDQMLNEDILTVSLDGNMTFFMHELNSMPIDQIMVKLVSTKRFYDTLIYKLNLSQYPQCLNLYNKTLAQNFGLICDQPLFQSKLNGFINDNFLQFLNNLLMESTFMFFKSIGKINMLLQIVIKNLIRNIQGFIKRNCLMVWDQSVLLKINNYIQLIIYPNFQFMLKFLNDNDEDTVENNSDYNYLNYLLKISYNELISVRINEIFKIILNFPGSEILLVELNKCLSFKLNQHSLFKDIASPNNGEGVVDLVNLIELNLNSEFYQRNKLVENFNNNCQLQLLNLGINTVNLIKIYIKIIKSFLIIDPKGVLLDKVIRPIRHYMKHRDDIINKLVNGLLNNDPELQELSIELQNTELSFKSFGVYNSINSDDFNLSWVPDPIDALPDFKKFKINDIIESLISIFDSKDLFVGEFTKIFGNKLLNLINTTTNSKDINQRDIELAKIFKTINLLKLRFGKSEFFNLDIMIKDFLKSDSYKLPKFNPLILSHLYWTDILPSSMSNSNDDSLKLPSGLLAEFNTFNEHFKQNNFNRYLKILPNFGNIKLKINNQEYLVSVDKAAIMYLFNDLNEQEDMLSVASIADELNLPPYIVKDALTYWCNEKVLLEVTPDNYITNE